MTGSPPEAPLPGEGALPSSGRIGYVLKMYPRFSETFIVTEILAREAQGEELEIFSLRPPVDPRFHASLGLVRAPVTYLPTSAKSVDLWRDLREARECLGERVEQHLGELLEADPSAAAQALQIAVACRHRSLTHLHAHFGSIAATTARLAALVAGISWSMTLHAKDIYHEDVDDRDLEQKIRSARRTVTVSDYNQRHLTDRFAGVEDRVVRVYNGIALDDYPFSPTAATTTARCPVVVAVGRLVPKKGFHDLVEAVALLRSAGREVRLELVGRGPEEDRLRLRVTELGLDDRVLFHGARTQAETRQHVRSAAVMAAPCVVAPDGNRDGLPTTILESLALGTPVVSTPVTGIPEAVVAGRTGVLVPPSDPAALAAALGELLDDQALRRRLSEAGRSWVEEHFDARANARLLRDLTVPVATGAGVA